MDGEDAGARVFAEDQGPMRHAGRFHVVDEGARPDGALVAAVLGPARAEAGAGVRFRGLPFPQQGGGVENGVHDFDVARAAAQMGTHSLDDLLPRRIPVALQQHLGAHEETGRAEAALHRAAIDEGHAESAPKRFGQSLKRDDLPAVHLAHGRGAGEAGPPVHFHKAGSAGRLSRTAVLGRGQTPLAPQEGEEGSRRVAAVIDALPVEPERNHGDSPQEGGKAGQGNFLEKGEYLPVSLSPRLHPFTDFRV